VNVCTDVCTDVRDISYLLARLGQPGYAYLRRCRIISKAVVLLPPLRNDFRYNQPLESYSDRTSTHGRKSLYIGK
jgi:hypothetical protein